MKQFVVSLISFSIVAGIVWGIAWLVAMTISYLQTLGLPAPIAWVGVGAAVVLCRPGVAIVDLASYVWSRVDTLFWRWF